VVWPEVFEDLVPRWHHPSLVGLKPGLSDMWKLFDPDGRRVATGCADPVEVWLARVPNCYNRKPVPSRLVGLADRASFLARCLRLPL
jgi:hypothetical protein